MEIVLNNTPYMFRSTVNENTALITHLIFLIGTVTLKLCSSTHLCVFANGNSDLNTSPLACTLVRLRMRFIPLRRAHVVGITPDTRYFLGNRYST